MGSLAHCITINDTPKPVADKLRASQKAYVEEGFPAQEATEKAILDMLGEIETQRKDIIGQINKQLKAKGLAPEAEHPVITKTRKSLGEETVEQVDFDGPQRAVIDKLAKRFGKTIVYYQGSETTNGMYDPSAPDTLFINVDNPDMALFVFGHELLHALRNNSPDLYLALFKSLHNHVKDFDTFYENHNKLRKKRELPELTPVQVAEEFFADFSGEQFTDPKFWQQLTRDNPTLFERIVEVFHELFARLGDISGEHFAGIRRAQKVLADTLQQYEARKLGTATEGNNAAKYNRDHAALTGEPLSTLFSIHERPEAITAMVKHVQKKLDLSPAAAKEMTDAYLSSIGTGYLDYVGQVEQNKAMYPTMEIGGIPTNTDTTYRVTVDLVGACVRMLRAMAVHKYVRKDGKNLTSFQMRALETELNKVGFDLTCVYCYAFTRRANAIAKLEEMKDQMSRHQMPAYNIKDSRFKNSKDPEAKLQEMVDLWEAALVEAEAKPRWKEDFDNLPDLVAIKSPADINLLEDLSEDAAAFAKEYPAIHALKQKETDAGNLKMPSGTIAIAGQIVNLNQDIVDDLTKWGGLRWQSNVDFIPAMTYDYVQGVVEMAMRNVPGHIYTKELDLALLLADSGVKVNLSAAPLVRNGEVVWERDKNGNRRPVLDVAIGSMRWEDIDKAMVAGQEHIGVMMLGVNDSILDWASSDGSKYAPYVIPWHSSGMPQSISKAFKKFVGATNYDEAHEKIRTYDKVEDIHEAFRELVIPEISKTGKATGKKMIDFSRLGEIDSHWQPLADEYVRQQNLFRKGAKVNDAATMTGFNIPTGFIIDQTTGESDAAATDKYFKLLNDLGMDPLFESYRQRFEERTGQHHGQFYWVFKKHFARTDTPFTAPDPSKIDYKHAQKMDTEWSKSTMAQDIADGNNSFIDAFRNRVLTDKEIKHIEAGVEKVLSNPKDPMAAVLADVKPKAPQQPKSKPSKETDTLKKFTKKQTAGMKVKVKADAEGTVVVVEMGAHEALVEIDKELSLYEKLKNCVGAR